MSSICDVADGLSLATAHVFADQVKPSLRIPYAFRRIPRSEIACMLPPPDGPNPGQLAVARLEKIGKNSGLELANGRRCTLHEGDLLGVVFGNRYATEQF